MTLVGTEINPVEQRGVARLEQLQRLGAGSRKALALPDLVQAAGVAGVAPDEVLAPDAQPACDPDVDCIRFGERTLGNGGGYGFQKRYGHGSTLQTRH
jgi:hypothetical protein